MNTPLSSAPSARFERAFCSLQGLSVGDAFGDQFFVDPHEIFARIEARRLPPTPWAWSDDTEMAQAIAVLLRDDQGIDPGGLSLELAARFHRNPARGYGRGAIRIFQAVLGGASWDQAAQEAFQGQGSKGNGGAMRAGPIGAYFADDLDAVRRQSHLSTLPTHTHPDGAAGAYAVALCAAHVLRLPKHSTEGQRRDVLRAVRDALPDTPTRDRVDKACNLPLSMRVETVFPILGNGARILSEDTTAFSLWCALRHLDDFEEAMWTTVSALGDRDTTCAIVGSLVALHTPPPASWVDAREPLDLVSASGLVAKKLPNPRDPSYSP